MTVERWEEETDEDWAERLAQEIAIANNTETTKYFFKTGYEEDEVILHYVGEDSWTWKEHPESPFTASQIIEWKNKAEQWGKVSTAMKKTVEDIESQSGPANISQIVVHQVLSAYLQVMGEVRLSTQSTIPEVKE